MIDHLTIEASCPDCGHRFNAAANMSNESPPKPGDISICARCAAVNVFNSNMLVVKATDEQIDALPLSILIDVNKIVAAVKKVRTEL